MKKLFKSTHLVSLALLFTVFSCNNDDGEVVATSTEINLEDLAVTIDENPTEGQLVGTVLTDGSGTLSFSITSQTPVGALSIASGTGELTVANAALFDFETNPVITASVTVVNAASPATVTINLANINEASVQDLTVAIDENPTNGQVLGTVPTGTSGTSNFSIASQSPAGAMSIDTNTGELTVADVSVFDFETNPVITASVTVEDAVSPATVTINLNDLNETPIVAIPGATDTEFVIGTDAFVTPKAYILLDDAAGGYEREFSFVFTDGAVIEDAANGIAFETATTHFTKITCNLIATSATQAQLPIFVWPVQNPSTSIIMEGNNFTNTSITSFNDIASVGGVSFGQVDTSINYSHTGQAQGSISHLTHLFTVNSITVDLAAGTGTIDCTYFYEDDNNVSISGVYIGTYEILTAF